MVVFNSTLSLAIEFILYEKFKKNHLIFHKIGVIILFVMLIISGLLIIGLSIMLIEFLCSSLTNLTSSSILKMMPTGSGPSGPGGPSGSGGPSGGGGPGNRPPQLPSFKQVFEKEEAKKRQTRNLSLTEMGLLK